MFQDGIGLTALHLLSSSRTFLKEDPVNCCAALIENGAKVNIQNDAGLTPLNIAFSNDRRSFLVIYMISAGGDMLFNNTAKIQQLIYSLKHISKESHRIYIDFLFESGLPVDAFIKTFQTTNSDLAKHVAEMGQLPRSLQRLAANVIRKAMVPNAWVGLERLPLPPAFDKQYIILHPQSVVSACIRY